MAGAGLWFVVCIPSEEYERTRYDSQTPSTTPKVIGSEQQDHDGTGGFSNNAKMSSPAPLTESLEKILRKTLEELQIFEALWFLDYNKRFFQVSFPCHPGLPCDLVLTSLTTNGIGICRGSTVGILPCSVMCYASVEGSEAKYETSNGQLIVEKRSESDSSTMSKTKSDIKKAFKGFKEMQKRFLKTVTARLTVAQVVEGVRANAALTFDFVMFVFVASMISALGLLENSSVAIVASMLISPIMGPILAATFGAVIRDKSLRNLGIKTEIIGLLFCLILGFIFGLMSSSINSSWGTQQWPNQEMISRGQGRSLWIGVLIALPSGAGVALSVLAGNAGSLVGVAISASLLPPTVNAGLLWGLSLIKYIKAQEEQYEVVQFQGVPRFMKPSLVPMEGYKVSYYEEMDKECAMLGFISLILALINIICIFLAAVVVLKIKEVAPKSSAAQTSRFWKEDIKIARDYNKSMPSTEGDQLGKQLLVEWANLNGLEPNDLLSDDEDARITRMETLRDILQDVEADEVFQTVAHSVASRPESQVITHRLSTENSLQVQPLSHLEAREEQEQNTTHNHPTRRSGLMSWLVHPTTVSTIPQDTHNENISDPDLVAVELRHPHNQAPPADDRITILRQSLFSSDNPYTLWPSQRTARNRFQVTPVPEVFPPSRQRISRFLLPHPMIIRETTC